MLGLMFLNLEQRLKSYYQQAELSNFLSRIKNISLRTSFSEVTVFLMTPPPPLLPAQTLLTPTV